MHQLLLLLFPCIIGMFRCSMLKYCIDLKYRNLVSFKVTLRSSGTDILYGCHLLLDILYFLSSSSFCALTFKRHIAGGIILIC